MTVYVAPLDLPVWNPLDTPVDKVVFDGRFVTPGYAEVIGASAARKWEEWSGSGWSGGILIFRGWPLSHFIIRMTLYETADWDAWNAFAPRVMKLPGGKFPRPHSVAHPHLARLGITALVIEAVRAPDQVGDGVWQIDLDCIEHRVLRKGSTSIADEQTEPVDPFEQLIAQTQAQRDREEQEYNAMATEGNLEVNPI